MKIVIAGAGEVGTHLAKLLSRENQDIVLIDSDATKLQSMNSHNILPVNGRPTSFKVLKSADIDEADLFIAVTPYETENVTACAMAKDLGAKYTVARIDNYEFMRIQDTGFFKRIGVDLLIYPELLAANEMSTALERSWVRNWFELCNGELIVVGVKLRENAKLIGVQLKDLASLSTYFHVSAIKRNQETIIPRGDNYLQYNDIVYFATRMDYIDNLRDLCGKKNLEVNRILVMGGSRTAIQLSMITGDKYRMKIIDNDMEKCNYLAAKLNKAIVIHGDGRDVELLKHEDISDYDAFVALTDSSETNILACLTAKELGVKKTIAEVETIQFINEAEGLNIGTVINKKLLASSKIFQLLLDTDSSTSKCLALADAEVAELVVKPGSKVTKDEVRNLNLSKDMTIAGLVRDGKGVLVKGNTKIQAGDHVVIFCLHGAIHKVEKLFN